jgi:hypothetical protein
VVVRPFSTVHNRALFGWRSGEKNTLLSSDRI